MENAFIVCTGSRCDGDNEVGLLSSDEEQTVASPGLSELRSFLASSQSAACLGGGRTLLSWGDLGGQ